MVRHIYSPHLNKKYFYHTCNKIIPVVWLIKKKKKKENNPPLNTKDALSHEGYKFQRSKFMPTDTFVFERQTNAALENKDYWMLFI